MKTAQISLNRMQSTGLAAVMVMASFVGGLVSENVLLTHAVQAQEEKPAVTERDVPDGTPDFMTISAGRRLVLNAGDEIVINTGSASITLKKDGDIAMIGKDVRLKGSGNLILKGRKIPQN